MTLGDGCAARARVARRWPFTTAAGGGVGNAGRSGHAGRPDGAVALDLQQCGAVGAGTPKRGPPGQRTLGEPAAARVGLQPASEPQDAGGKSASGPGRAVHPHQPPGAGFPAAAPAGGVGGHEEKGACRPLQERGSGVASARPPGTGSGPRFPGQGTRQGDSVRRVRPDPRRRVDERRRRSRHGVVRGGDVAALVGANGLRILSGRSPVVDHG